MIGHQQHPLGSYTMRKSRHLAPPPQQNIYAQTISRGSNLHPLQYLRDLSHVQPPHQQQIHAASLASDPRQQFYYEPGVTLGPQERSLVLQQQKQQDSLMGTIEQQAMLNRPLCRCRVMYLGSSVPHITKNGLHGIQEPLKHLYPEEQFSALPAGPSKQQAAASGPANSTTIDISHLSSSLGIDSWLSVWSNGLLLENVDEFGRDVKRFFSIESLHYCAAVRFFDTTTLMPNRMQQQVAAEEERQDLNNNSVRANPAPKLTSEELRSQRQRKSAVRFLPLDAPLFQCPGMLDAKHPPVFASILRRTTGIKVLECHAFICRRDAAANALVRCCTHAYADFLSAKRLSLELGLRLPDPRRGRSQGRGSSVGPRARPSSPVYETTDAMESSCNGDTTLGGQHSSSTGLSQEELDNSLEAELSSEDNYAIISRHHQPSQQQKRRDKTSSSEEEGRRAKGSSRSLFTDFMPQVAAEASARGSHSKRPSAMEKLSHSMDLLGLGPCCPDEGAQYAVVRNKRHSRSMQNLDGPFEFSASAARSSRSQRSRSGRGSSRRDRRSASYQDMWRESMDAGAGLECRAGRAAVEPESAAHSRPQRSVPPPNQPPPEESRSQASKRTARKSSGRSRDAPGDSVASRSRRRERQAARQHLFEPKGLMSGAPPVACCAPPAPHILYPGQQAPMYLPYYLPYGQPQQHIYATGGSLYESLAARGAYLAPALVPQLQQQQAYQQAASSYATASRKAAKGSTSKRSLARFRCLSPPVNFLGGKAPLPQSAERRQQQAGEPARESTAQADEEPAQVVSAEPGFISSAASVREKSKMSWIKRLSLTMSSSAGYESDPHGLANLSTAPDGGPASQQPKRRSSLFSGSLTLGRRAKQHQQPHASVITSRS